MSKMVEPEIPGNTIAEMATMATKKMYIPSPKFKICNVYLKAFSSCWTKKSNQKNNPNSNKSKDNVPIFSL